MDEKRRGISNQHQSIHTYTVHPPLILVRVPSSLITSIDNRFQYWEPTFSGNSSEITYSMGGIMSPHIMDGWMDG